MNGTYVDRDCYKEYKCIKGPTPDVNIIGGCDWSYEVCKPVNGIYRCVCKKGLKRDKDGNCVPFSEYCFYSCHNLYMTFVKHLMASAFESVTKILIVAGVMILSVPLLFLFWLSGFAVVGVGSNPGFPVGTV